MSENCARDKWLERGKSWRTTGVSFSSIFLYIFFLIYWLATLVDDSRIAREMITNMIVEMIKGINFVKQNVYNIRVTILYDSILRK